MQRSVKTLKSIREVWGGGCWKGGDKRRDEAGMWVQYEKGQRALGGSGWSRGLGFGQGREGNTPGLWSFQVGLDQ